MFAWRSSLHRQGLATGLLILQVDLAPYLCLLGSQGSPALLLVRVDGAQIGISIACGYHTTIEAKAAPARVIEQRTLLRVCEHAATRSEDCLGGAHVPHAVLGD